MWHGKAKQQNIIRCLHVEIFPGLSLVYKLVPVNYLEYVIG